MCPWDSYLEIQQGLKGYEDRPLAVVRWFSQKRVHLHVPSFPAWYLGERCSLQETQLTQEGMDTSVDPAWRLRVADIDGTNRLLDVPHLSDVSGVPSAGLYHDTEYTQYLDESRRMYVSGQQVAYDWTASMYEHYTGMITGRDDIVREIDAQIQEFYDQNQELEQSIAELQEQLHRYHF
ncbi:hypothetical protein GIB67_011538 [Kingdonia uniflora]|uniref:Uncharacterized protein n=1 Tax=Kingdonia uniflora TaxID=39325 RepID=A0A7J7NM17_9MAGN|nr:hypothetical protein GIB67_011538 [Kingdonia uniflora]